MRVKLTVVVNFPSPRFATFDVQMTVRLYGLYGKLHFECEKFPETRFLLSFYQVGLFFFLFFFSLLLLLVDPRV